MVRIKEYKDQLIEMAKFYVELPERVESDSDKYNAKMEKKASEKMLKLLEKSGDELKKSQSNQLDALLMSLTREGEQFEDKSIYQIHRQYGQLKTIMRKSLSKVL